MKHCWIRMCCLLFVNDFLFTECALVKWLPCQKFFLVNIRFYCSLLKFSHQRVKGGPSLYSFKLLVQGDSTNKLFLNRYVRHSDWTIRQSHSILAKNVLTHFTVFSLKSSQQLSLALLLWTSKDQNKSKRHSMSQSREEITTTVYFFQHFTAPIFSPVFHVSFFSSHLSLYRLWATWALASSPWPLMWRLPSAVFSSPPRATG